MTFDDGILEVYRMENTAPPGAMPKETPILKGRMTDIVKLDDGSGFRVLLAQKMKDDNGLQITKLTLERLESADVPNSYD